MTNTCEQIKHSIHGKQKFLFMWCQQTPLLGKHKLRSQALVGDFRQPPSIHNIGTYPPQNGHAGCDMPHRLTHKRPHLCQSGRSRTRQTTDEKKISSRSPRDFQIEIRRAKIVERKPLRLGRTLTTRFYTVRFLRPQVAHNKTQDKGVVQKPAIE